MLIFRIDEGEVKPSSDDVPVPLEWLTNLTVPPTYFVGGSWIQLQLE